MKSTSRQYKNSTMMCINTLPINLSHYSCEFGKEMCLIVMKISECKNKQRKNKIKVFLLHKEN